MSVCMTPMDSITDTTAKGFEPTWRQPVTEENFTAALESAVADKGADHVYDGPVTILSAHTKTCRYFDNGAPTCLVGAALHRLGYTARDVTEGDDASSVLGSLGAPLDVCVAAEMAQVAQDEGETWGVALSKYYNTLEG